MLPIGPQHGFTPALWAYSLMELHRVSAYDRIEGAGGQYITPVAYSNAPPNILFTSHDEKEKRMPIRQLR